MPADMSRWSFPLSWTVVCRRRIRRPLQRPRHPAACHNRPRERSLSNPVGDGPAGESMELRDHVAGGVHGPQGGLGVQMLRNRRWWARCPAVQPFRLALIADEGISDRLQPLEIGRGIELAAEHPLAEVVPLREEPGPELEARDLPGAGLVDEGLQGSVRGQDRQAGLLLALAGQSRHLIGDRQQHARLEAHTHFSADYRGRVGDRRWYPQRGDLYVETDEDARICRRPHDDLVDNAVHELLEIPDGRPA